MTVPDERRIRLLLGTTGSGKTTKMAELIKQERRVFLFDLMAAVQFEEWGVLVDNMADAMKLALRCISKNLPFRIRMQFSEVERFDWLCSCCVKSPHGLGVFRDVCIAVDELAFFTSPHFMPKGLENVVRLGRHTQARFMATSQRPPDLHPFIRSQAKEQYLFQMHEPADLDHFRKRIPYAERLTQLKTGEYILWTPKATKTFLFGKSGSSLSES